jgi:hypothetical protein
VLEVLLGRAAQPRLWAAPDLVVAALSSLAWARSTGEAEKVPGALELTKKRAETKPIRNRTDAITSLPDRMAKR